MKDLLDVRDKLSELEARLAALQALFLYEGRAKVFGYPECWGIDLTIQTIADDLGKLGQSLSTVQEVTDEQ